VNNKQSFKLKGGIKLIKLICKKCGSDKILYIDKDSIDENFKCEDCDEEFTFQEAEWETEF